MISSIPITSAAPVTPLATAKLDGSNTDTENDVTAPKGKKHVAKSVAAAKPKAAKGKKESHPPRKP
ncbi:MAG TPA: hypothetical protein VIM11_28455 [Tepidisphaeraceae bacterium]